jgi:glycosyltransferase involved in cell wall biosynthesis
MSEKNIPLISVIIPNYNNEKYLEVCIDSVLKQTYSNIEIIVVDDCSTDASWRLLNSLKDKIKSLSIYMNENNKGVSYTRNRGVEYAIGEYITTLDPDDLFFPDKIQSEYDVFIAHDNSDIVAYSSYTTFTEELQPITRVINKYNTVEGDIYCGMLYRAIHFSRDILIKKKMFIEVGGFNESLHLYEDWDFKLRLAKQFPYYFSGVDGIKYRQHSNGLSSVDFTKHIKSMQLIFLSNNPQGKLWLFNLINKGALYNKIIRKALFISRFNRLFSIFKIKSE